MSDAFGIDAASSLRSDAHGARVRAIALCFVAQNASIGLAYGSFGPLLGANQAHFGVDGVMMSSAMSVMVLSIGLGSTIMGMLFSRLSWFVVTLLAALSAAIAYGILAETAAYPVAIGCFVIIGLAVAALGIIGPISIMRRLQVGRLASVMGVINLPLALVLTPLAVSLLLPIWGRNGIILGIGAVHCALAAILGLLYFFDVHLRREVLPLRRESQPKAVVFDKPHRVDLVRFWVLSIGVAVMAGCGTGLMVHVVPFGISNGMDLRSASSLLSLFAFAGMVGGPFWGWIGDRFSPVKALLGASLIIFVATSFMLISSGSYMAVNIFLIGACLVPLVAMHSVAISEISRGGGVEQMMGFSYVIKLPFQFSYPVIMAYLFSSTQSYTIAFLIITGSSLIAAMAFSLFLMNERRNYI